ncbi:MAG: hypothetical protein M3N50_02625 [Pseudomonadota bacterium]|nr:hypothetical protein [Pseudomonadota bacterium]
MQARRSPQDELSTEASADLNSLEDKSLVERVQAGMGSRSHVPGPLGRNEVSLRSFARRMRELIPVSRLEQPPSAGWQARNESRKARG